MSYQLKAVHYSNVVFAIVLPLSVILLFISNYCNVGFTSDSYRYFEIAKQIEHQGLLSASGLNIKPPIYPLLIYWFGESAVLYINTTCFAISVSILFYFGLALKSKSNQFIYWGLLLFSTPLYLVHSFAWTEPPFITILLLAFYLLHINRNKAHPYFLYVSIALLFLLPFIRFAGIFIVVPAFLFLLLQVGGSVRYWILTLVTLAVIGYAVWVLRFSDGFGDRWHTFTLPFQKGDLWHYKHNLDSYLEAVSLWILPLGVFKPLRLLCAVLSLITLGVASFHYFRNKETSIIHAVPFIFLCYYVLLHFVFKVEYYSAERYLTPIYNLLILSMLYWYEKRIPLKSKLIKQMIAIGLIIILAYSAARTVKNVLFWNETRCSVTVN